jgi:hypothetical protein
MRLNVEPAQNIQCTRRIDETGGAADSDDHTLLPSYLASPWLLVVPQATTQNLSKASVCSDSSGVKNDCAEVVSSIIPGFGIGLVLHAKPEVFAHKM